MTQEAFTALNMKEAAKQYRLLAAQIRRARFARLLYGVVCPGGERVCWSVLDESHYEQDCLNIAAAIEQDLAKIDIPIPKVDPNACQPAT